MKFVKTALTRDNYRQVLEPLLGARRFPAESVGRRVERRADSTGARTRRAVSRYLHRALGRRLHRPEGRRWSRAATTPCAWRRLKLRDGAQECAHRRAHPWRQSGLGVASGQAGVAQHRQGYGRGCGDARRAARRGRSSRRRSASRSCTSPSATPRSPMCRRRPNEFVNTWSVDGFVSEGAQPAELGWGTHEKHFPADGGRHTEGSGCAIYLNRPGASTRVRTWTPAGRAFPRLPDHALRSDFAGGLLHRHGRRAGGVPADHPLRLSPERQRGAVGA